MSKIILTITLLLIFAQCQESDRSTQLITESIRAHGQHQLMDTKISFTFRDKHYAVARTADQYVYTRSFEEADQEVKDVLVNSKDFVRIIDGDTAHVADTMQTKYANSVNSVLYFVQLPFLLQDPAVNTFYEGFKSIKDEEYHVIKVTFRAAGGGEDFQDEYRYWIHQENKTIDYLAYSYQTEGGGVRFRSAYNRTWVEGILFQDYINYEVPVGTSLHKIPGMYEKGQLKTLSRIVNEAIEVERR